MVSSSFASLGRPMPRLGRQARTSSRSDGSRRLNQQRWPTSSTQSITGAPSGSNQVHVGTSESGPTGVFAAASNCVSDATAVRTFPTWSSPTHDERAWLGEVCVWQSEELPATHDRDCQSHPCDVRRNDPPQHPASLAAQDTHGTAARIWAAITIASLVDRRRWVAIQCRVESGLSASAPALS